MKIGFKKNIPLAPHTTFKIGGPAQYFFEASSKKEIIQAIKKVREKKIPFFILGKGSNLLIGDEGFKGLVIKLKNTKVKIKNHQDYKILEAEAGIDLQKLVKLTIKQGLTGLEWAAGIPGSLGGAVRGNAGAFGHSIKDIVLKVEALQILREKISLKVLAQASCKFSYRNSIFKDKDYIILSVHLQLKKDNPQKVQKRVKEYLAFRQKHHPLEYPSAGSVFKNVILNAPQIKAKIKSSPLPPQKRREIEKRMQAFQRELGFIPAGWLIEKSLDKQQREKDLCLGDACISKKHSNFIINQGQARAQDVLKLIELVKKKVYNKFKIKLKPEIQIVTSHPTQS